MKLSIALHLLPYHHKHKWKFYYLFPYPNTMGLWPQWRSPLVWDAFAVMTYGLVSLLFWYLGLLPDLGRLRDAARGVYKRVILKEDRIVGTVLYGDTTDGNWYFDLLKKGEDVSDIREALIEVNQAVSQIDLSNLHRAPIPLHPAAHDRGARRIGRPAHREHAHVAVRGVVGEGVHAAVEGHVAGRE